MPKNTFRYYFFPIASMLLLVILAAGIIKYLYLRNNIHEVIPTQVYRSAQLSPNQLNQLIKQKKIKSIINLRGVHLRNDWFKNEVSVSQLNQAKHFNVRLNAHELPPTQELHKLVEFLQNAPKPILIHCKSGADRTGLASAIALILNNTISKRDINEQISWKYLVSSSTSIGRLTLPYYYSWLTKNKLPLNKDTFLTWAFSSQPFIESDAQENQDGSSVL